MLTIGDILPDFRLLATVGREPGEEFRQVSRADYRGQWLVLFFWPMDFTFVCPTEIIEFDKSRERFERLGARLLGGSTDSEYVHLAWREQHPGLRDLSFPMLADKKRELASSLGILHREEGVALRATFIVDPDSTIRWVSVYDLNVGRNVDEVVRTLEALQTGELTPCGWRPGDEPLRKGTTKGATS